MEFKDYYATLGVPKTATDREIKQAYRKLARKHHPDVNPGDQVAEARFKDLNEAYEVLRDAERRRKYDELGANWRHYEQAQQAGGPFRRDWSVDMGGPGGFRTMTEEEFREAFGGEDPFSDFFRTFFGAGFEEPGRRGRARAPRSRRGTDVEQAIELELDAAYSGTTRRLAIKHGGHARTVDVRIPAGVADGARVRIAGEGEAGTGGAAAGDLYLRVRVRPHPRFERRGSDLYARAPVPVTDAVLGGEADVPSLGGKSLRLRIPPMTQPGQVFRLRGQGMPVAGRPGQRGDLYATVEVQLPRRLSPEQRSHYEALREFDEKEKKGTKHTVA